MTRAEPLLQDMAWLKRLATMLAHDRDDADDLVQEAWIAAWRRQPDAARPMRGWLTKVVRDLAGMKHRADRRRAARHLHLTDDAQPPAPPDALLAQLQLHKRLVDLVIELDEPYRSTIIQRFVEGRTSASIAQSLGIPAGTVRKRLHEALARLRAGLDASAGDRERWAPAVIAFAQGGMYVAKSTKLVVVVVAALLLASVATLLIVVPMRRDGGPASAPSTSIATGSASSRTAVATDARTSAARPLPVPRAAERAAMLAAIARAREGRRPNTVTPTPAIRAPGAHPTPSNASTATTLNIVDQTGDTSDWQKRALATLNHLLGQCYDLGRAEDPNPSGTVTVRFTLVGEPDIGGLLERVEVVDKHTTITQQTLRDCLTQQLYALELDPPPDGVTVERELHLRFP